MNNKFIMFFFNKKNMYASILCWMFGCLVCVCFSVKYILADQYAEYSFGNEDIIGVLSGLVLFVLFFPISILLYFTNTIGKDFFLGKK